MYVKHKIPSTELINLHIAVIVVVVIIDNKSCVLYESVEISEALRMEGSGF